MRRVNRARARINKKTQGAIEVLERDMIFESRMSMIQTLIPLGLQAVEKELQLEISKLVGDRYSRGGEEIGRAHV